MSDYFLTFDNCLLKLFIIIYFNSFILTFYVALRPSPNVTRCFSWLRISDVTSEIKSSDVTFIVAYELSQAWARQNFPAPLTELTLSHRLNRPEQTV